MKKVQREVKTYTDIFVSVDGKEFTNENDCREWEKSYKGTLEASWYRFKKVEANSCDLGLPWSSEDHECYLIRPKDFDEIVFLNAYVDGTTFSGSGIFDTDDIGKVIAINFGYDHDYCDVYRVDTVIADIAKYTAKKTEELSEVLK